jgi:DNA polymerase-4
VQLKVRFADFRTITRSRTLRDATDVAGDIATVARALLGDVAEVASGVRLLGVGMQQLSVPEPSQPDLFGSAGADHGGGASPRKAAAAERAVDAVRARFGSDSVFPLATRVEHPSAVRDNGGA